MADKKHIALITTWFPPQKGVAVNRMNPFTKYLDTSKYNISVFTLLTDRLPQKETVDNISIYRIKNNSFLSTLKEKPGESKLIHNLKVLWNLIVSSINTFELLDWKNSILHKIESINRNDKIDLVISSYSPIETHLAAIDFCKKYPYVKWIADMRDEMSGNPYISNKLKKKYEKIELEINQYASAITMASQVILKDFDKLASTPRYYEEIRNGFDHAILPKNNFNEIFTISYAGTLYADIKPETFFEALKSFTSKTKTKTKIKLQFIGTNKNFNLRKEFENASIFFSQIEYEKAVELISASDANLFLYPQNGRKGVYTGKLFDYISVMKPIIALCDTADVAAQLIRETHSGFVADFNNIGEIENAIDSAYQLWKERKSLAYEKEKISLLHRKYQVKKLETIIDKLISE